MFLVLTLVVAICAVAFSLHRRQRGASVIAAVFGGMFFAAVTCAAAFCIAIVSGVTLGGFQEAAAIVACIAHFVLMGPRWFPSESEALA